MSTNLINQDRTCKLVLLPPDAEKPTRKKSGTPKPKPKRRCVRIDEGADPETGKRLRKAFYGKTLKEAREKRDAYLAAKESGASLADRNQTLAQWVAVWQSTYIGNVGYSTRTSYENACEKLCASLGPLPIRNIREVDVRRFALSMSHYSKSAVSNIRITTRQIFRRALANRIIEYDPSVDVVWDHSGAGTHRYLSPDEISTVCTHWHEHTAGVWAMVMLWAGLRRGEALALRWSDVDLDAGILHVRHGLHFENNTPCIGAPKTPASVRDVPIFPPLRAVLESIKTRHEFVCCTRAGTIVTQSSWSSGWRAYNNTMTNILNGDTKQPLTPGRRSDLDKFRHPDSPRLEFSIRAHDLRHTFASMLYDAGVDVKTAQKLLGHTNPEITMRIYTHLSNMRQAASVEKMAAFSTNYLPSQTSGHQMGIKTPENPIK